METITLTIKNKEKFFSLLEILMQLDAVEVHHGNGKKEKKKHNIFKSAGMWGERDISLNKIRAEAWSARK